MKAKNAGKPGMKTLHIGISFRPDGATLKTKAHITKGAARRELEKLKANHFKQGGR